MVQRLRESIARTVGEAVANVVHEITRLLIQSPRDGPARSYLRERDEWDNRNYSEWDDDPAAYDADRFREDESDGRRPTDAQPSRWRHALSAGCEAAAWWLRRNIGRYPIITSTSLGLTAALISYAAGPIVGVGLAGIGGALLHLLGLTDAVARSAAAVGH